MKKMNYLVCLLFICMMGILPYNADAQKQTMNQPKKSISDQLLGNLQQLGQNLSSLVNSNGSSSGMRRRCQTDELMAQRMTDPVFRNQQNLKMDALHSFALTAKASNPSCVSGPIIIPVAFHFAPSAVGTAAPTAAQKACIEALVDAQMVALNKDYAATNSDISNWSTVSSNFTGTNLGQPCIQFCLATQNHPAGYGLSNGDKAITYGLSAADASLTPVLPAWSGYLNIFIQSGTGVLGIAYTIGGDFAGSGVTIEGCTFSADPVTDCYSGAVGAGCSGLGSYNLGRTLTHEIGHYLGLYHTFSGCTGSGDFIADTPPDDTDDYGCYSLTNTAGWPDDCAGGLKDLWMNYMDYTDDACMWMFTSNQSDVMYAHVISEGFTTSNPTVCQPVVAACPTSVSAVTASATSVCSGTPINYSFTATGSSEYQITYTPTGGTATTLAQGVNTFSLTPTHPGTCGTSTYTVTYTITCTLDGSTLASSSVSTTVYPTPTQLASMLTIANGACDGPVVTNSCPSLITVTPQAGSPTFPVAAGASGTVSYDVVYNLGPCCVSSPGAQLLTDGNFEDGDPAVGWTESSTNYGSVTCNSTCGGAAVWGGTFYTYFAGASAGATFPEVGTLSQTVTIPTGVSAALTFELSIPTPGMAAGDVIQITVNGTVVWSLNATTDDAYLTGHPTVTVNLSSYATGAPSTIVMTVSQAGATGLNVYADNFALNTTPLATGCNVTMTADYNCVSSCDAITALSASSFSVCEGTPFNFTTSTDNNDANGIKLVYSTSALANPYSGGTVIGTSTGTGATATYTGATLPVGTYFVYAILNPTPTDATCRPFASTTVIVNAIPSTPTSANVELCGSGTANLTASGCPGGTLYWYNAPTGGTPVGTGTNYSTTVSSNTTFYVDCTVAGCTSARTPVLVTVNPVPSVSIGGVMSYCSDENVILTATVAPSGASVTWDYGTGTAIGTTLNVAASSIGIGLNTITATATLGACSSSSTYDVSVGSIPGSPSIDPASILTTCAGNNINIIVGTHIMTTTTSWYFDAALTSPITAATGDVYTFTPSTSGSVWVVFTDISSGCQSGATQVDYVVETVGTAVVNNTTTLCADVTGNTLDLNSLITSGDVSGTWTLTSGVGTIAGTTYSVASSTPADQATLTYTIAGSGACVDNVYNAMINFNDCTICPDITSTITLSQTSVCSGTTITACVNADLSNDNDATVVFSFDGVTVPGTFTADPGITPSTHTIVMNPLAPYTIPSETIYVGDVVELPGTAGHPLSTTVVPVGAISVLGATSTVSYTVTLPGTYSIICDLHPSMTGTFTVLPLPLTGTFCADYTPLSTTCGAPVSVSAMFDNTTIDATCDGDMQGPAIVNVFAPASVAISDLGSAPGQCGPFTAGGTGCGVADGDEVWSYCVDFDTDGICDLTGFSNIFTPMPGTSGVITFTLNDPDALAGCGSNTATASFNCPVGMTMSITDPCVCAPGGMFSDEVTILNGMAPYTIQSVAGAYTDVTAATSLNAGDVLGNVSSIWHADGVGYDLTVIDALGNVQSISNTCYYPTATISASDLNPACNTSIDLTANTTGTIVEYVWHEGSGSATISTGLLTTDFTATVQVTDAQGCVVNASQAIDVMACSMLIANPDAGVTQTVISSSGNTVTPVTVNAISNDSPTGGVTLVSATVDPTQGTVSIDPTTGDITFTPEPGFVGDAIITYTITDGVSSANGVMTITVTTVLPISLLNANASSDCKSVKITWTTGVEENTNHYIIERSTNGVDFEEIGSVLAAGYSSIAQFYNYTDNYITTSMTYYRIVEVDNANNKKVVKLMSVQGGCANNTDITELYPNPTTGILNYTIISDVQKELNVEVVDITGRILYSENIYVNTGLNSFRLDASNLASSVYFISLMNENHELISNKKFVKSK